MSFPYRLSTGHKLPISQRSPNPSNTFHRQGHQHCCVPCQPIQKRMASHHSCPTLPWFHAVFFEVHFSLKSTPQRRFSDLDVFIRLLFQNAVSVHFVLSFTDCRSTSSSAQRSLELVARYTSSATATCSKSEQYALPSPTLTPSHPNRRREGRGFTQDARVSSTSEVTVGTAQTVQSSRTNRGQQNRCISLRSICVDISKLRRRSSRERESRPAKTAY